MTRSNEFKPDWPALMEEALTMPGSMGETYNRFYTYSTLNQLLLLQQGCPVEPIATYKGWLNLNRQVQRGSKARGILRPITVKREDEKGEEKAITRFKLVNCIFPYSATEGEPLPEYEPPAWSLNQALGVLGINRVAFEWMDGNTQGLSYQRNIMINPVAAYPLKTAVHEMAHVEHGHTVPELPWPDEPQPHRGIQEFEAEGTAYLVMNEIADDSTTWNPDESRAYIADWLSGERPGDQSIRRVFKVTDKIIKAGRIAVNAAQEGDSDDA